MPRPQGWTPTTPIDDVNLNANTKDVIGDLNTLNPLYFTNSDLVSAINAVPSMMNKTFYVDAVNGNDANDGSQTAPFQTIIKAVNSIPTGGYGTIVLTNNQTHDIDSEIWVSNKVILFKSKDPTSTPGSADDSSPIVRFVDNGTTLTGKFRMKACHFLFSGWSNPVKVQVGSSGNEVSSYAFNGNNGDGADGSVALSSLSFAHTNITAYANLSIYINYINLRAVGITVNRSDNILIVIGWDGGANGVLQLVKSGGYIQDALGNDITTSCAATIVRDANGVPRNIVSNIVF